MAETVDFSSSSSSSGSPADCRYGITLTREISTYEVEGRPQAWRMIVTASGGYNMTDNIFMFLRKEAVAAGQQAVDTFEAVASPVDIEEYPPAVPVPDRSPAFYRLASIDLLSRNQELLELTWDGIKSDVEELVRTLANICELETDIPIRIGYDPDSETVESTDDAETSAEPESSSGPEACPVDSVATITIQTSNDPDFRVADVLTPSGGTEEPPDCTRTWLLTGAVSGSELKLETSLTLHTFVAYLDSVQVDSGGLADGYIALINYEKPGAGERNLAIAAS